MNLNCRALNYFSLMFTIVMYTVETLLLNNQTGNLGTMFSIMMLEHLSNNQV